ncbi:MAG: hypothetical protein KDA20_09675 [Phycisphaerales bacterium]|nr:hypothetical protein [Phycisphaerales bacterium]
MARIWLPIVAVLVVLAPARWAHAQNSYDFENTMAGLDYEAAAKMAIEQAEATGSPVWMYNAACALGKLGKLDDAADWLVKSADAGFAGVRSIETDSDLDPIRTHPRFTEAEQKVRANAQARFDKFKAVAETTEPLFMLPPAFKAQDPHTLIIVLHGSGGTGASMRAAFYRHARKHSAILMTPDALRPDGRGFSWVYRDEAEWYILHCLQWAKDQWNIDRVILVGYSQGANICFDIGQSHAELFDAVLPINGHYEADLAPLPKEGKRPKWYLLIGANDGPAPTYAEAEQAFTAAGMEATRVLMPEHGHEFPTPDDLAKALTWCCERKPKQQ